MYYIITEKIISKFLKYFSNYTCIIITLNCRWNDKILDRRISSFNFIESNISIKKIFHFKNLKIKKRKKYNRSFNP